MHGGGDLEFILVFPRDVVRRRLGGILLLRRSRESSMFKGRASQVSIRRDCRRKRSRSQNFARSASRARAEQKKTTREILLIVYTT